MSPEDMILIYGAFPASLIFTAVFAITRKKWWNAVLGWVIFSLAISINIVFGVSFLFYMLGPDYPGRSLVKAAAYILLTVAFLAKTAAVIYERNRGALKRANANSPHS